MPRPRPPATTDIDALYGLEPVFEPGGDAQGDDPEPFVDIDCPWCGEPLALRLDLTAGAQRYIEDCQVCCAPINVAVGVDEEGHLAGVEATRADR